LIDSISAKNLLCFDETEHILNCAPLTVIVGPNNSGKSAMIAAFNFLRDLALVGVTRWMTESYNLGDFTTAVHDHDLGRTIGIAARIHQDNSSADFTTSLGQNSVAGVRIVSDSSDATNLLRTVWYFRASRSDISRDRPTGQSGPTTVWGQPLDPSGSNIITYLLERWTDQDKNWPVAQEWLKRIDPELSILKSPLRGNMASLETTNRYSEVSVNLAYQGTGIQKALAIVAAVIFSPPKATIIIEEPEVHLERRSIEALVDLFNHAVTSWNKQIILSTHSMDLLLQYASDLGVATPRGRSHDIIDASKFKLVSFERNEGKIQIREEDMKGRFTNVMDRIRALLKPAALASVPA